MLDDLRALIALSRHDAELASLREEHAGVPARQAAFAEERAKASETLVSAREAVVEAEQAQRQAEGEAQDQEAQLAKLEGQQHQVKSNEAYTALLSEMDQARTAISDAETRVLEAMERIEEARGSLATLEEQVRGATERIDTQEKELEARAAELGERIAGFESARADQVAAIDATLVARSEKSLARRAPAVALVSGELCLGCRVGIPPQAAIELLKGEEIVTCGTCQRILIREELVQSAD
ncbi:MAG: zinc ribbon domain-containing protein [Myxococcota bacterium]